MRCGRCGNENNDSNRFCGMCGAALVEKSAPADQPAASVTSTRQVAVPGQNVPVPAAPPPSLSRPTNAASVTTERRAGAVASPAGPSSSSGIAGPSFLGLNTPPQIGTGARPGSYGAHDSLRPSSGSLDYLLEEDEDEPRHGWGKLFFVVVALALAAGFGYLRFKQGGFDWLTNVTKKPAAAALPDNAPAAADSGKPGLPESAPAQTGSSNPSAATAPAANNGAATTPPDSTAPTVPSANGSESTTAQNSVPAPAQQPSQQLSQAAPQTTPGDTSASSEPAAQTDNSEDKAAAETASPAPKARPSRAAPAPKPSAARAGDTVGEAERYINGRGVPQDCDHGLRILKPAAEQANPKAMISLGALYSTGTCTPRDLPTAYSWFARALHKQPDNQVLQDDLQKLWSQMTPPERQLAIKLSQ